MATVSYVLSTNVSPNFTDNLNDLGNGILKVTQFADPVSYAAVTIAEAGVDYQAASSNLTSLANVTPALGGLIAGIGSGWELLGFGTSIVGDVLTITDSGDTGIGWTTPTAGTVESITFTSTAGTINITGTNPVLTTGTVNLDIATVSIAKGGTGQSTATNAFDALSPCTTAGDTSWYNGTHNVRLAAGTEGQVLTVTGTGPTTLGWSTNGGGSVTSVAASSSSGVLISGSPITSSGTITINLGGSGVSNAVVQGDMLIGNGSGAYVGLALGTTGQVLTSNGTTAQWAVAPGTGTVTSVAVTSSDLTVGGSPITTAGTITLSLNTVPVAKGGTNFTSYTTGDMLYASGSTAFAKLNIGAIHNVLVSTGTAPAWVANSPVSGQVLTFNGSAIAWENTGNAQVGLTSTSGILITGSGTNILTVNLDGTGISNAVAVGDILVGTSGTPNTYQGLAIGTSGQVLRVSVGGTAEWASVAGTGTVTSVGLTSTGSSITITGATSPITASGTYNIEIATVSAAHGGTGQTSYTTGDMLYASGATAISKLGLSGTAHQVLTNDGSSAPEWSGGVAASGNILTYNGTNIVWAAPASSGTVTSVAAASSTGILVSGSPITSSGTLTLNLTGSGVSNAVAVGDLLLGGSGTYAALAIGANGRVLTSNGTTASWAPPVTASNWSTYPATSNVNMGNFNLGISATGEMVNTINLFALTSQPTMPTVGGTLGMGAEGGMGTTAVGLFAGLPALDNINFHQVVTVGQGDTNYGATNSLLVGNAVGSAPGDYNVLAVGSIGNVLTINGSGNVSWAAPATSGTVTSVAATSTDLTITGSPITSSGTLNFTLNTVPTGKGGTGLTSYTAGDISYYASGTALSKLGIGATNSIMASSGSAPEWVATTTPTNGQVLTYLTAGGIQWSTAASGTVTSVSESSSTGLIIGGSPITTSGTITVDLPGSGVSSAVVAGDLLLGTTGSYAALAIGANTQVLTSNGTTATWTTPSAGFPLTTYFDSGTSTFLAGYSLSTTLNNNNFVMTANGSVLRNLTSGGGNLLLVDTGANITSGGSNIIIGNAGGAGRALTSGNQNVFIGISAGNSVVTSFNNTLIGNSCGANFDGSGNTFIGEGVGVSQNTYTNCVLIGDNGTDCTVNSLNNALAIGSNAQVSASNTAVIGSNSLTGLGIGTDPSFGVPYSITVGTSGSGGVYLPRSTSQTISTNGGVYGVNASDQPYFTNQSGTFVLTPSTPFTWNTVSGTTQTLSANNGYICTNASQTTATLPSTASVGDTYEISAYTAAGWTLLPGTVTQIMRIGNAATTASTGSLTSTQIGDTLKIVCMNATTPGSEIFVVTSSMGNITIV